MKLVYRPEIDGLRAIAVGSIILYHSKITLLGYQPFKSGFIGVDIFFVISGYLITSIILKELIATGSFSLKYFYERRIRRILPSLLFIMLVTLPFAWICLLPNSFIDFSKSILYSIGFSSNFYFHYSGQEYGADSGLFKPFLHTWSLSVEEQFYIIFPLILLITFKYFRRYLYHILIFGFVISLVLADWTSRNYPSNSFYLLHTRMWEILAGSVLAYLEITKGRKSQKKILNLTLPLIGLILIFYSILFFNDKTYHPSFYTLIPITGVCLIIWFSNKDEFITKILSTKLFVGIGLISYSLYLWHYPIFAFARITEFFENNLIKELTSGLVILFLSIFNYYFLEKPFRNKKYQFKKLLILLISSIFVLVSFNYYVINNSGINKRFPQIFQTKLREKKVDLFQRDDAQKIVLIGDSHVDALEFNLNEEIKKKNLSLFKFNTSMYLKNFNFINSFTNKIDKNYNKNNIEINSFLEKNSDLIIILHQRWSLILEEKYFDNKEGYKEVSDLNYYNYLEPINIKTTSLVQRQKFIRKGLLSNINNIINKGHKLILVYPIPEMGFNVPKKLLRINLSQNITPVLSIDYNVFKERNKLIFEILDSIEHPNIYRVYPHKLFCNQKSKNRCTANDEKNIFYYDDDHLSLLGSKFVVEKIIDEIEKIKTKGN